MAKIAVIGSGVAGLTAAAYLQEKGHSVTVYEQYPEMGGVTATYKQDGFAWDLGPMLLEGFGRGEPAGLILEELGIYHNLNLRRGERGLAFPGFSIWPQAAYGGPYWRREFLKRLFPGESEGLDGYYRFYDRVMDLMSLHWQSEKSGGLRSLLFRARAWRAYRKVREMSDWSAARLMDHFFEGPELKALYTAILADFVVRPSRFPALAVPAINVETPFDLRMPLQVSKAGPRPGYHYVLGGCEKLVAVLADKVRACGGVIHTNAPVSKIVMRDGRVAGIVHSDHAFETADLVVASGGVRETMFDLVGQEHLPAAFIDRVNDVPLMESVHMIHLGVDYDFGKYQPGGLCYYYQTYDIEDAVDRCQRGIYHEGKDGFLAYIPSLHSPEMAPEGLHAVTIYTIAPNRLDRGDWSGRGEELSDRLLNETEKHLPGLTRKVKTKVIMTPEEFKERTHLKHHAFGGRAPVMGKSGGPHRTPVDGLWFVGSQSEKTAGGVSGTMTASRKVARMILKDLRA